MVRDKRLRFRLYGFRVLRFPGLGAKASGIDVAPKYVVGRRFVGCSQHYGPLQTIDYITAPNI